MHALTAPLSELAEIEEICEERGREPGMLLLSGCVTSQKTHLMYALGKGYGHTLIVLSSEDKAKKLYEEYRFLNENTSYYPAKDLLFYQADIHGKQLVKQRMETLQMMMEAKSQVTVITTIDGFMDELPSEAEIKGDILTISNGEALEFESLTRDPFLIAAPPDTHLSALAKQKEGAPYPELDPALLGDEPFLMVSPGQRIRQITDRVLAEAGVKPNIVLTSRNYELLRRLTGEGMGCMLLPSRYIGLLGGESYRPAYYMIPPKYRAWWALSVVRLREAYLSRAAQAFLGSFKAHLAEDSP